MSVNSSTLLSDFHKFHKNIFLVGYESTQNTGNFRSFSIPKKIRIVKKDTIVERTNIKLTSGSIKLSYEALIPLMSIGGHELRLLLYIIAYCANKEDNSFKWTHLTTEDYCDLYRIITGETIDLETPRKALWNLKRKNIVSMSSKGNYVLNPLYTARPDSPIGGKSFIEYLKKALLKGASLADALFMKQSKKLKK